MVKKVGYAQGSVLEQDVLQQMKVLKRAGCKYIFPDWGNETQEKRSGLQEALKHLHEGDTLVVCKLKALGSSTANLIEVIKGLKKQGVGFKSVQDNIDIASNNSEQLYNIFNSLIEYQRDIIRERTHAGLEAARARGRKGGRPKAIAPKQIAAIKKLHADKNNSITSICKMFNISRPTLYAYLKL